jgi:hypothetical protein
MTHCPEDSGVVFFPWRRDETVGDEKLVDKTREIIQLPDSKI